MNDFLPEFLAPVHYFLIELNNDTWLNIIRVFAAAVVIVTAFIFFLFRKKLPVSADSPKKQNGRLNPKER